MAAEPQRTLEEGMGIWKTKSLRRTLSLQAVCLTLHPSPGPPRPEAAAGTGY